MFDFLLELALEWDDVEDYTGYVPDEAPASIQGPLLPEGGLPVSMDRFGGRFDPVLVDRFQRAYDRSGLLRFQYDNIPVPGGDRDFHYLMQTGGSEYTPLDALDTIVSVARTGVTRGMSAVRFKILELLLSGVEPYMPEDEYY